VARLITLTTDFGHKGPFVGVMKGAILRRLPEAVIVDLSHEIPAHWPIEAGFWVAHSYGYFPAGTVHVAVVDPGSAHGATSSPASTTATCFWPRTTACCSRC
jgi:S-adenosylmethionine hydrolase